jgi:hypothetical protein
MPVSVQRHGQVYFVRTALGMLGLREYIREMKNRATVAARVSLENIIGGDFCLVGGRNLAWTGLVSNERM